jgi:hypothetical protein
MKNKVSLLIVEGNEYMDPQKLVENPIRSLIQSGEGSLHSQENITNLASMRFDDPDYPKAHPDFFHDAYWALFQKKDRGPMFENERHFWHPSETYAGLLGQEATIVTGVDRNKPEDQNQNRSILGVLKELLISSRQHGENPLIVVPTQAVARYIQGSGTTLDRYLGTRENSETYLHQLHDILVKPINYKPEDLLPRTATEIVNAVVAGHDPNYHRNSPIDLDQVSIQIAPHWRTGVQRGQFPVKNDPETTQVVFSPLYDPNLLLCSTN